jgi:hypothetical protein
MKDLNESEHRDLLHKARTLSAEIKEHTPHWAEFTLYPAVKGGWKAGYSWSGNYRMTITSFNYGRPSHSFRVYKTYIKGGIEEARCAFDRADKYGVRLESYWFQLLCLYRDCINEKPFAKRVMKTVRVKFGKRNGRNDQEVQAYIRQRAFNLLFRHRGVVEEIDGLHFPDGRIFDDMGTWANPPHPAWGEE